MHFILKLQKSLYPAFKEEIVEQQHRTSCFHDMLQVKQIIQAVVRFREDVGRN